MKLCLCYCVISCKEQKNRILKNFFSILLFQTNSLISYIVIVIVTGKKDKKRKVENLKNLLHENSKEKSVYFFNNLNFSF